MHRAALGEQAVVLGASIAGLLAARALADRYERVVVVERDALPAAPATRRGVPQGRHAHLLLPRGAQAIDELFPGFLEELVAEGVPLTTGPGDCHLSFGGHVLAQHGDPWPDPTYHVSRTLLEGRLLDRVRALPRVEVRDGHDVVGLAAESSGARVSGARVRGAQAAEEVLDADLTVVATGRSGRAGRWLQELGCDPPAEEQLKIDLQYVSCRLRMTAGALGPVRTLLVGPVPDRPTGVVLIEQEDDTWFLTASGYAGHHPPTQWPAFLAFLGTHVAQPVVAAVAQAERLTPLQAFHYPASLRRRYGTVRRFPEGLLVVGDAVCSFNPLYGQGMTVAALQALALRDCVAHGGGALARRYYRQVDKPISTAWQLATGADLTLPSVPGPRPLPLRVLNRYVDAVQAAGERDPAVVTAFLRVTSLLDPPSRLLAPATVARVARAGVHRPRQPPAGARTGSSSTGRAHGDAQEQQAPGERQG